VAHRGNRKGLQSIGGAARHAMRALGLPDPEQQKKGAQVFDRLFAAQFHQSVTFLGVREGRIYLRVRDGAWRRRVDISTPQILAAFDEFLAPARHRRVVMKVGPAPEVS
jgi:hypothetical protein